MTGMSSTTRGPIYCALKYRKLDQLVHGIRIPIRFQLLG